MLSSQLYVATSASLHFAGKVHSTACFCYAPTCREGHLHCVMRVNAEKAHSNACRLKLRTYVAPSFSLRYAVKVNSTAWHWLCVHMPRRSSSLQCFLEFVFFATAACFTTICVVRADAFTLWAHELRRHCTTLCIHVLCRGPQPRCMAYLLGVH